MIQLKFIVHALDRIAKRQKFCLIHILIHLLHVLYAQIICSAFFVLVVTEIWNICIPLQLTFVFHIFFSELSKLMYEDLAHSVNWSIIFFWINYGTKTFIFH